MAGQPDKYYLELAEKWLQGTITEAEMQEYADWYNNIDPDATLDIPQHIAPDADTYRRQLLEKINERRTGTDQRRRTPAIAGHSIRWIAAAVLVLLTIGIFWLTIRPVNPPPAVADVRIAPKDLLPGASRATLTLAGGRTIILDSAANGMLATQGNSKVRKLANGRLTYVARPGGDEALSAKAATPPQFNTLATPRGGQYQLTLPDGTGVWLNAASSITYPTVFSGNDRAVYITGEVYFEVAKNKDQPFKVFVGSPKGMEVNVLGTYFNINAYEDEADIKTTLLTGSVRIRRKNETVTLLPGQQALATPNRPLTVATDVNTEEVMAWKNGLFQFDNADIHAVMRQLARWYNVDVSFEGHVTEDRFAGKLPRAATAAATLHILEMNQVHFRIEDKKIIVMP
jgi:transmembrane sensor